LTFSRNVNFVFQQVFPVTSSRISPQGAVLLQVTDVWYLSSLMVIQKCSAACFLGGFLPHWSEFVCLTKWVEYRTFKFVIHSDLSVPYGCSWSAGQGTWNIKLHYCVIADGEM